MNEPVAPLAITQHTLVTALGHGLAAHAAALAAGRTGLAQRDFETAALGLWLGIVDGLEDLDWPAPLAAFDCRNNRLAELGLRSDGFGGRVQRAAQRWGAGRVGVFLGTSTAGILHTEIAYRQRDPATGALPGWLDYATTHNAFSVARYVRERLGLAGPACVVSTACSSSAKVYALAERMVRLGQIDAAVVGGVDSLCLTTLYGFRSLELTSPDICRPWDQRRAGLSIGEAAAFALLERGPASPHAGPPPVGWLIGSGESSDGHHMSSPHPEGVGAMLAMRAALAQAGLQPQDVDYLNLHGTGTPGNDAAEDAAVAAVFGTGLPCSSTKGFTGHTLGAAGAVEASLGLLAMAQGLAPASLNLAQPDPALRCRILREPLRQPLCIAASNSFGFGGSNACLLFAADPVAPRRSGARAPRAAPRPGALPQPAAGAEPEPLSVAILGIGVLGPGLVGWDAAAGLLRQPADWRPAPTAVPPPARLPATERRRAGVGVQAAVLVADAACAAAGIAPAALASVFASSSGEPSNCHALCEALAAPQRLVSPTRFTNSVHNAAAGSWHIAVQGRQPSSSLGAFDGSFAAGLLEAAVQCVATQAPVLLVASDVPYPEPLHAKRPTGDVFAVALVIAPASPDSPDAPGGMAPRLTLRLLAGPAASPDDPPATACGHAGLDALRLGVPAARALPLLQALAEGRPREIAIEGMPGFALRVTLEPR